jgi:hypothetical protein
MAKKDAGKTSGTSKKKGAQKKGASKKKTGGAKSKKRTACIFGE